MTIACFHLTCKQASDESIYDFISRRFSPVVANRLLDPMVSGIFGGNIRHLSIRSCFGLLWDMEQSHGSIVRAMLFGSSPKSTTLLDGTAHSSFVKTGSKAMSMSFTHGMQTFTDALAAHIEVLLADATSTPWSTQHGGGVVVRVRDAGASAAETIVADHVFSALPAPRLAPLVQSVAPSAAAALSRLPFTSLGVVTLGFHRNLIQHSGFGYLVPTCENQGILGVIYDSCSFPQQNFDQTNNITRLSVFVGGENHPAVAAMPRAKREALALETIQRHLGVTDAPVHVESTWYEHAIPQYPVGYHADVASLEADLAQAFHASLTVVGNSFYGVGLSDCVHKSTSWRGVHHGRRGGGGGTAIPSVTVGFEAVSGSERAKYSKRPILPYVQAIPPDILLAPAPPVAGPHQANPSAPPVADEDTEPTRSIGIQTMYRDSEAQTTPYTPDFTVKAGTSPEIATLTSFSYENGLPAGMAEVELIQRNRQKRAFDASLPPMTDEASFELRKRMMEQQEKAEWAFREVEIDRVHDQRLQLLEKALVERDHENQFLAEQRIEALRQRLTAEKEETIERIQQERVTALRKLAKRRAAAQKIYPKRDLKRDIIGEYTAFGSTVYAPVTRAGKSGKHDTVHEVGLARLHGLDEIQALEVTVGSKFLAPSMHKPPVKVIKTAKDRREAAIEGHLLSMQTKINQTKTISTDDHSTTTTGGGTKFKVGGGAHNVRPPTPLYGVVDDDDDDAAHDAVRLLQKLLRGRAVQNTMFEGKGRRTELIAELREAGTEPGGAATDAAADANAATLAGEATVAKIQGEVVSDLLDFLAKELVRVNEHMALNEFVMDTVYERRKREVIEGGRRHAEEMLRKREDVVFQSVQRVHDETADDFVMDVLRSVVEAGTFVGLHIYVNDYSCC
ncbi:hypothetical protein DYB30_009080 [Aphanomyces astaci]|uniref:Cilia- and flagella-associated protein 91 n=1 Tax=Aphanomyces astaci TaxID=112090 RepID=A0A397DDB4_APHAT|nr:hypothetical protein DYB30_009080 [Aphanomyces astaci]